MKVAFLANSYHLTATKSADFFIELLREWFGLVEIVPHKEAWARLPGTRWDLLIAWQHQYDPRELEAFGARTTVLVPMFDDCPKTRDHWIRYQGFKVLCFSQTLGSLLEGWGLDVLKVQYYQPLPSTPNKAGSFTLRGFFWPRTRQLDWSQVRVLASGSVWESFHLHLTNEEGRNVLPDDGETAHLHIVQTHWFDDPEDFRRVMGSSTVFFAPRRFEGIGQAVLEALALGLCVVAPDLPTMNEYIQHGVNGLLYDPDRPVPMDFQKAEALGIAARAQAEVGRELWVAKLPEIQKYLGEPTPRSLGKFHLWISFRGVFVAQLRNAYRKLKGTA